MYPKVLKIFQNILKNLGFTQVLKLCPKFFYKIINNLGFMPPDVPKILKIFPKIGAYVPFSEMYPKILKNSKFLACSLNF
jgi:hypothetical protein